MLHQTYFTLVNENALPAFTVFVDPSDEHQTSPRKLEGLAQFSTRINTEREQRGLPAVETEALNQLVTDVIYELAPIELRETLFKPNRTPPTLTQAYSFFKATAQTLINGVGISPKQRQARAEHCLGGCAFHSSNVRWSSAAQKVTKAVSFKESLQTPAEKILGHCKACGGCPLQEKVKYDLTSVLAALTPDQIDNMLRVYPKDAFTRCWMLKEALQDPSTKHLLRAKIASLRSNAPYVIQALQKLL